MPSGPFQGFLSLLEREPTCRFPSSHAIPPCHPRRLLGEVVVPGHNLEAHPQVVDEVPHNVEPQVFTPGKTARDGVSTWEVRRVLALKVSFFIIFSGKPKGKLPSLPPPGILT